MPAAEAHGQAALPVRHRGLLTVGVMLATMMQILDTTIANVAIPHMQTSLGATLDTVSWVLTSYIVAAAVAIPITGWLADRIGSRRLFLWSVAGFIAASMLCGIATSLSEMVLFRLLQGIFGAFIGPLSQTVMLDINPPERQAKAMAVWGMGIMIGPIMGPIIGGWLTENYNWRWVFYVNLPVGLICFALLAWLLPSRPINRRGFDLSGYALLAVALASLQLMLDRGSDNDWFNDWEIRIEALIALSAGWMFVVHMFSSKRPLFDRRLLGNRNMATAMVFMIAVGMMMLAVMALMPPMLQRIYGYSVLDTGMLLAPRGIGILISMFIAGQLAGRVDARLLIATGFSIAAASLWQMSHFSLGMDWHPIVITGVIQGLGMGLVFVPLNGLAFATLEPRFRTDGSSLLNLFRNLGGSIGISIVTTVLSGNAQTSHEDLAAHITPYSLPAIDPSTADRLGSIGDAALRLIDAEINRQALMIAYLDDFRLIMIVMLLCLPLVLVLRPSRARPGGTPALAMAE